MSYWLEDADGYLGDLATNIGINQLREGPPSLIRFLDDGGTVSQDELDVLVDDLREEADPHKAYLVAMLDGAVAPVKVTDGVGFEEE